MLTLKPYQQRTLDELKNFLVNASTLKGERGIRLAYLDQVGDEERHYKPISGLDQAPYVCIKIPTAGGKTLVASHALQIINENFLQDKNGKGLVMWFVPSEAIKSQTLKNLKDRNHPYREVIDVAFGNNVKIFAIDEALSIQKSDIQNNLCIVVSSLQAFRRTDTLWLKVFKNNGALLSHFQNLVEDIDFLDKEDGEIIYSLANVIKINSPIVILDEGHNAQTLLSFEMLQKLNPSFMLEFTATPRSESNVLVKILATELKTAKMVKIPIWLANVTQWQEAIRDGVDERNKLEKLSLKEKRQTKEYIRPICLLQAEQEKESESKIYVEQIKKFLLEELRIPDEQIAIKTATKNEIEKVDLLSPKCPIRYILTVNALKEGWDCPFAYVLISVANIGSTLAVEQTIGRILRLPKATDKKIEELNNSYVYTSSESFSKAGSAVIKGLEQNGYSRADLRENKGKIVAEKSSFKKHIKDNDIKVPYLGLKTKKESLAFNRDLIGNGFKVYKQYKALKVDFYSDQSQRVKIDIDKENNIFRITQGKLSLILYPEDFSLEEVANWLKRNVRNIAISADEMNQYIDLTLKDLSKTFSIQELSLNRFRLKEAIQNEVFSIIEVYAKNTFDKLLKTGNIDTKTAYYSPEKEMLLTRLSSEHFQRHLFVRAGYMNTEETDVAMRLDVMGNIVWWYRSREKLDFYLQGWKAGKFYPDFIVKTKKGIYVVIEYKGEQLATGENTKYKVEVGKLWESLSKGACKFFLVEVNTVDKILKEIAKL
jgi:restriction endonuclease